MTSWTELMQMILPAAQEISGRMPRTHNVRLSNPSGEFNTAFPS
jgi:hypothetical protein